VAGLLRNLIMHKVRLHRALGKFGLRAATPVLKLQLRITNILLSLLMRKDNSTALKFLRGLRFTVLNGKQRGLMTLLNLAEQGLGKTSTSPSGALGSLFPGVTMMYNYDDPTAEIKNHPSFKDSSADDPGFQTMTLSAPTKMSFPESKDPGNGGNDSDGYEGYESVGQEVVVNGAEYTPDMLVNTPWWDKRYYGSNFVEEVHHSYPDWNYGEEEKPYMVSQSNVLWHSK